MKDSKKVEEEVKENSAQDLRQTKEYTQRALPYEITRETLRLDIECAEKKNRQKEILSNPQRYMEEGICEWWLAEKEKSQNKERYNWKTFKEEVLKYYPDEIQKTGRMPRIWQIIGESTEKWINRARQVAIDNDVPVHDLKECIAEGLASIKARHRALSALTHHNTVLEEFVQFILSHANKVWVNKKRWLARKQSKERQIKLCPCENCGHLPSHCIG